MTNALLATVTLSNVLPCDGPFTASSTMQSAMRKNTAQTTNMSRS